MSSSMYGGKGSAPSGQIPSNTSTGQYGQPFQEKIPKGYKTASLQTFTPEQMQLFQQSFGQVSPDSYTGRLAAGDQGTFDETEAPALRQFNEMQGNMASRFSGMGSGARRSSGFQNAGNQAASNFAQDLQSKRQGLQRQAQQDLWNMSQQLMGQRPYERSLIEEQRDQGFDWGGAIGAVGGGAAGFYAGGPTGAMKGASMGYNAFGRA